MTAAPTERPPYSTAAYVAEFNFATETMSNTAATSVLKAYAAWQAGKITTEGLAELVGKILTSTIGYATNLADVLATRAVVMLTDAERLSPVGLAGRIDVEREAERLTQAAQTIADDLDKDTDPEPRFVRLAKSEAVNALQQGAIATLDALGVDGYVRGLDNDPCELCVWLYRDGYVWPTEKPMHRHPGCECQPIPVIEERNAS